MEKINDLIIDSIESKLTNEFQSVQQIATKIIRDNLRKYIYSGDIQSFVRSKKLFSLNIIRYNLEYLAENSIIDSKDNQYKLFDQDMEAEEISYL